MLQKRQKNTNCDKVGSNPKRNVSKNPVPKGLRRVKGLHLMLDVGHLVNQMTINLKIGLDNVDIF